MLNPTLDLLLTRRSVKPVEMTDPGPVPQQLELILRAASRVPDHKKLTPWRFVVFEGEGRNRFGKILADALVAEDKERPSDFRLESESKRLLDAPTVVAVISRITPGIPGAPEWEQILSAGAACFNLCIAANSYGFATNWLTGWYSYSPFVMRALGLSAHERIAGFIYIGTAKSIPDDRERPTLSEIVTRF